MQKNKQAFTLVELLVVVLIIGILAAIAVPQYQKAVLKSKVASIWSDLATLEKAKQVYCLRNGDAEIDHDMYNVESILDISATSPFGKSYNYYRLRAVPDTVTGDYRSAPKECFRLAPMGYIGTGDLPFQTTGVLLSLINRKRYCAGDERVCKALGFTNSVGYTSVMSYNTWSE